jgi:transcriptional regulator with XRE-family HTH domain
MTEATAKNRIKELRQKLGLSAKKLAERVDTTEATISRIESGKQNLSQTWLQKISQALGVHITALLDEGPKIGRDIVPVIARIENGKWLENHFFKLEDIYPVPVAASLEALGLSAQEARELSAFEPGDAFRGIILAVELSKLKAANYIGKAFVVLRTDHGGRSELSLRILEHRQQGLYLVSKDDDPCQQAVRLDDENVAMVWRIVMEYRIC